MRAPKCRHSACSASLSPPLQPRAAATPDIHAHRGGTVVNGQAALRARRASPRTSRRPRARLRARGGREAHRGPRAGGDPRRDARPHHELQRRGAHLHARRAGGVPAPTCSAARAARCPRARPRGPRASRRSRRCSRFARRTGAEVNLEIKNVPTDPDFDSTPAFANRVMDVVLASRIPRRQLHHPELRRRRTSTWRGSASRGVATSLLAIQAINEAYPPDRRRQRLRLHLAASGR